MGTIVTRFWSYISRLLAAYVFQSGGSEWCTHCLVKHSMRKRSQTEELSILILWYCSVYM